MAQTGLMHANKWAVASVVASMLMLLVALASPETPLWPFIVTNWLVFVRGMLVSFRKMAKDREDVQSGRSYSKGFVVALIAFAACGHIALAESNSLIQRDDQLTKITTSG